MKFFFFISTVFISSWAFGQSDSLNVTVVEEIDVREDKSGKYLQACEAERQAARKDILAGKLTVEYYEGITIAKRNFEFDGFYRNYLIARYGIEQRTTGCMTGRATSCYFEEMDRAISEKYGESFLDTVRDHALEEYKTFNTLDAQRKKKYIDFNYVYFWVDQPAAYETGIEDLQNRVKRKIDFNKFDLSGYKLKGFHAELVISEAGIVTDCTIASKKFPLDAAKAVREAVVGTGGWKPAVLYGSNVKSRTGFSVIF
ncbi:MAG TPA: hypothetical protein PK325_08665 [Cyclobacteriaceae bacterium]|nr:hypothetical protein [Cyclobacteriaceae bacterium]HMV10138.1 hypothetical protein [Cyclobacteriaceae bacterium]HMV90344.1 hypothetical protein [Cyclobacteriaceae bacterium]HMX00547.1 hypothetical protein [Cyclobacteriaceae bacterium]HMX49578.1 hypothetical protein [Cyclobacteriaceae bacterium]